MKEDFHEAPPVQTGQDARRALIKEARLAREKADQFPADDAEREVFLKKAREFDADANIDGWLNSRGLQPPK
ncbi:hypothetical protein [Bradyrhizobium sp. 197]|jgi:hypothetical protein|uniref:hypothetical protein n=1 Tax=Bradyrhizobium sp. 197 TaxID=2782663 RepID=UPI001FF83A5D|nr:hypothetical protein [Bradyrhizobium sp. 197]